jgi:hypothetical protein
MKNNTAYIMIEVNTGLMIEKISRPQMKVAVGPA